MKAWFNIVQYCCLGMVALLAACQPPANDTVQDAEGYISGHYRYITLSAAATLKELYVQPGTHVKVGQPLFSLDITGSSSQAAENAIQQAKLQLRHDQTDLALARLAVRRHLKATQQQGDIGAATDDPLQTNYRQTQARVAKDRAKVTRAEASLAQSSWAENQQMVMADTTAMIINTYFIPGKKISANKPVLSLLAPQDIEVIFFVPQATLNKLALNQTVPITCKHCPEGLSAKIAAISQQAEVIPPLLQNQRSTKEPVYRINAKLPANLAIDIRLNERVVVGVG